jgi:Family of unknown function (DUF5829)
VRRLALVVSLLAPLAAGALAAQAVPPPLYLNHLYVVLDSATWHDVQASTFLAGGFGAHARHDTAAPGEPAGIYLYGHHTWLVLMGPGGFPGAMAGDVGIALGSEQPGGIVQLARHLAFDRIPFDTTVVMRQDSSGVTPWYRALHPGGADSLSPHDDLWIMEYTLATMRRVAARDSFGTDDRDRDRILAAHYDSLQLLGDVSAATLAVPSAVLARMSHILTEWGVEPAPEGTGIVVRLPAFTLRLIPAYAGRGVKRLTFDLNHEAIANPTYRFGLRSRLLFGPGATAVWEFGPP